MPDQSTATPELVQVLLEPDNLKYLVPICIAVTGLTSALVSAFVASISAFAISLTTHILTGRAKINEIRINRRYDIAEKLANSLESSWRSSRTLHKFYVNNLEGIQEATKKGEEKEFIALLIHAKDDEILLAASRFDDLVKQLRGAWLYLPDNIIDPINDFCQTTHGTYTVDGTDVIAGERAHLFNCFTDESRHRDRERLYIQAVKSLRKLQ